MLCRAEVIRGDRRITSPGIFPLPSDSTWPPPRPSFRRVGSRRGRVFVGVSGFAYPEWRGPFYPTDLAPDRFLAHAAARFDSIELDGTFYSLKTPAIFARWAAAAPDRGFIFAVKGSRYITHILRLAHVETALANFYASGVLALGKKTGPFLWQLPPGLRFDPERLERFLETLPRSSMEAERIAAAHDARLDERALIHAAAKVHYRHAVEVRHPSFVTPACFDLLRRHDVAAVIADTAGKYPFFEELTASFVYVRLHGAKVLYAGAYGEAALEQWADRVGAWAGSGRDVHVYFDNTADAAAPQDALRLAAILRARGYFEPRRA